MLLQPLYFMALVVVSSTGAEFFQAKDLKTILQRIEVLETRDQEQQNTIDLLQRIEVLETREQEQQNKIDLLEKQNELQENEILAMKEREENMANLISERCADRKTETEWTDEELVRQPNVDNDVIIYHEAKDESDNDTVTKLNPESRAESEEISDRMHRRTSYQKIRRLEGSAGVAFTATLTDHIYHLGTHQTIAFDKVITNVGNAYHAHVGTFIAPITGVYVFSTTVMSMHIDAYFQIVRNGVEVTGLWIYASTNGYQTSSQTVNVQLNQGDDVCIQNIDSDKMLHGNLLSTFSGFLLY